MTLIGAFEISRLGSHPARRNRSFCYNRSLLQRIRRRYCSSFGRVPSRHWSSSDSRLTSLSRQTDKQAITAPVPAVSPELQAESGRRGSTGVGSPFRRLTVNEHRRSTTALPLCGPAVGDPAVQEFFERRSSIAAPPASALGSGALPEPELKSADDRGPAGIVGGDVFRSSGGAVEPGLPAAEPTRAPGSFQRIPPIRGSRRPYDDDIHTRGGVGRLRSLAQRLVVLEAGQRRVVARECVE